MVKLAVIFFTMILVDNYVLAKFLGICPFLGVSKKLDSAVGMSLAVTFVMVMATAATWPIYKLILCPDGMEGTSRDMSYLQTIVFILIIAILVQLLENFLKKFVPALYKALGVYLPLITTNCAVLGVVLQNTQNSYNFLYSLLYGLTGGLGFMLAIFLFASVRERQSFCKCPKSFEGFPIALITAGLLALSFMGFSGLDITRFVK